MTLARAVCLYLPSTLRPIGLGPQVALLTPQYQHISDFITGIYIKYMFLACLPFKEGDYMVLPLFIYPSQQL